MREGTSEAFTVGLADYALDYALTLSNLGNAIQFNLFLKTSEGGPP